MSAEAAEDSVRPSLRVTKASLCGKYSFDGGKENGQDERRKSLEKLYIEMRNVGEASVKMPVHHLKDLQTKEQISVDQLFVVYLTPEVS